MDYNDPKEFRELQCGTVEKLNDQVVLIRFRDGFYVELNDAISIGEAALELFEGRKFVALIDARNIGGTVDKEASNYFAQNEKLAAHRMAQAIVVNSLALRLVARFYIMINKPLREARVFDTIEEAMEWLETKKHLLD